MALLRRQLSAQQRLLSKGFWPVNASCVRSSCDRYAALVRAAAEEQTAPGASLQGLRDGLVEQRLPLLDLSEAAVKAHELREGQAVSLTSSTPCSVSFAAGQERHVQLGLHGLPEVQQWLRV